MINIRNVESRDAESLGALAKEVFTMPWSLQAFRALAQDKDSLFLVVEDDGRIIGGCGLTHIWEEGDIHNVMIAKEYRGRGLAIKMLEALMKAGTDRGIKEFTLEVRVSNQTAIRVYEKLGFVSEGIRPRFYEDPVEDAMIMWKR